MEMFQGKDLMLLRPGPAMPRIQELIQDGSILVGIAFATQPSELLLVSGAGAVDPIQLVPRPTTSQSATTAETPLSPSDKTEVYSHHGTDVHVRSDLRGRHRSFCLCFMCSKLRPGQADNCPIAQAVFENCVKYDIVTPMWECPKFETLKKSDDAAVAK